MSYSHRNTPRRRPPVVTLTRWLPEGYRIIDDGRGGFWPQRTNGARFATRTVQGNGGVGRHGQMGSSWLDDPLSFEYEADARALIVHDAANPRPESFGSVVYTVAEVNAILAAADAAHQQYLRRVLGWWGNIKRTFFTPTVFKTPIEVTVRPPCWPPSEEDNKDTQRKEQP